MAGSFTPSKQAWKGAAIGIFIATLLLIAFSTSELVHNQVSLGDAAFYFTAGSLITAFIGATLVFLWAMFAKLSPLARWAVACFALIAYYFFIPAQTPAGIMILSIWTMASFSLVFGSLWSLIGNRNDPRQNRFASVGFFLIGLLGILSLVFWLYWSATPLSFPPVKEGKKTPPLINLPDPALQGDFKVKTLSYGHGNDLSRPEYGKNADIITPTVNGKSFIKGWNGISGWLRTWYWGFDNSSLPLNGLVWYPEGKGPFPLVLIVHGNHEMSAPSEKGYSYLAELLASRGFIVVSIDQLFLNSSWMDFTGDLDETAARAWLILEHLNLWREWNSTSGSLLENKIDMARIALIGHSRGGEAIFNAAAFNKLDYFPDDGNVFFDYHFSIKALAAIAPVDSPYMPGGQKAGLQNIDYLVIQGAHDGDVRSFQGNAQYNRISFFGPQYHFKAALYIFGANHGQFNTLWGKNDLQLPASLLLNTSQFLSGPQQRKIAEVYISAFLAAVFHNEKGYMPLFHSWKSGKEWLPQAVYINEFNDSKETLITNSEGSLDLGKTLYGSSVLGENLKIWRQKQIMLREGNPVHPGIYLGWNAMPTDKIPSYSLEIPEHSLKINPKSVLVLSIADATQDEIESDEDILENEPNKNPIDFTIELTDSEGEKASLKLSHVAFLQPSFQPHLMKSDFLDPLDASESIFQTFEFPMEDFVAENAKFKPELLERIRLVFDHTKPNIIVLNSISIRND